MRTQSRDTTPEVERVLIELIRKAPISKRFGLVRSMTATLTKMSVRVYREQHPQATWSEIVQILRPHPHQLNLQILDACLQKKSSNATFEPDILHALSAITDIFKKLSISYYIGGSLASAAYGMQQLAQDIDLVVELLPTQVPQFIALLQADYYVDQQDAYAAVQNNKKFTIIHLETLLVIDIIIPFSSLFEKQANNRVKWHILDETIQLLPLSSPEDIILIKLFLYRKDKIFPDDQWNDILGVLKVQGSFLDLVYLETWAAYLSITYLLEQAYIDSGIKE
jgi:hypothetical protein